MAQRVLRSNPRPKTLVKIPITRTIAHHSEDNQCTIVFALFCYRLVSTTSVFQTNPKYHAFLRVLVPKPRNKNPGRTPNNNSQRTRS